MVGPILGDPPGEMDRFFSLKRENPHLVEAYEKILVTSGYADDATKLRNLVQNVCLKLVSKTYY